MKRLLFVVALLAAGASQAGGFSVNAHTARVTGMGEAVTAHLDDASSIAYNPAGLAALPGFQVLAGDTLISPRINFAPAGSEQQQRLKFRVAPPPHLFAAVPILDGLVVGVGAQMPFGADIEWPDDFVGRFLSTRSRLFIYDFTPTVAYAPVDWIRVGAGMRVVYGNVDLQRRIAIPLPTGTAEGGIKLSGDDWGLSYVVGAQVEAIKDFLSFGLTYRHKTDLLFDGDAEFSDIPEPARPLFRDQPGTAAVTLPATLTFGVAVEPVERLRVAFDVTWWSWSRLRELAIRFEDPVLSEASSLPKGWHTRYSFSLGAEYGLSDMFTVRAGVGYEPTPIPEETLTPELPDLDRLRGHVGLGVNVDAFQVGAGYELLVLHEKESTFPLLPGTYNGTAHVLVLTVGYTLGGPEKR